MGTPGSVRFQFEKKGYFAVEKSTVGEDKLMEVALEAGADDLQVADPDTFELYTQPDAFESVRQALERAGIATIEAKLGMIPANFISVDPSKSKQMMKLMEILDDHDDVQNVWSNFDVPDDLLEANG
jgi:transcriptional/translational regulatory protein YebC/TACO1